MSTISELLQAVTNLQANAQNNLPVMPNNGNPQGAYNMPKAPAHAGQNSVVPEQVEMPDPYAWLKPSSSMQFINQYLQNRQTSLFQPAMAIQQPAQQQQTSPTTPMTNQLPTLPQKVL